LYDSNQRYSLGDALTLAETIDCQVGIYAVNSSEMAGAVKPLGELLAGLGARLRSLRNQQGWTLEQLSLRTNLSEPFLSRIESGRRQPSLAALLTLARAHSMPLASLLEEVPAAASLPVVIQAGSSSEHYANGLQFRVVSGTAPRSNLHAVHVTIPPKREHQDFYHHDGEEWLYVLSGHLRLIFEDREHLLKPGDSAHFEARTPHRLAANGRRAAEAVIVSCAAPLPSLLLATSKLRKLKGPAGAGGRRPRLLSVADADKFTPSKVIR
jgi:quercetin dioxygenase-like cupin family protein/DNA-binding XRE family transcriptional regulator